MPTFSSGQFNGGTISGAVQLAYTGDASTTPFHLIGSPQQTPANDATLFQVDDGNGGLRVSIESNGTLGVTLDGANGGVFNVADGPTQLFGCGGASDFTTVHNGKVLIENIPVADPHFAGQLYSVAGVVHVSAG